MDGYDILSNPFFTTGNASEYLPNIGTVNPITNTYQGIDPSAYQSYSPFAHMKANVLDFGKRMWNSDVMNGMREIGGDYKNNFDNLSSLQKVGTLGDIAMAGANIWNAWQTNKMAKKQFDFQKQVYAQQYDAQRNMTNSRLEDRQRARVLSNPNAYRSIDSYMSQYGVK